MNRRDALRIGLGAVTSSVTFFSDEMPALGQMTGLPASPLLTPFVDPLPIPGVIQPVNFTTIDGKTVPYYEVPMRAARQKLHRDLPATPVWGYAGLYPGPSFEVRRGQPIAVRWINDLPEQHLLSAAIDPTLHGAEPGTPEVRTVVHLHGGRQLPESDGDPEAWFTKGFLQKGDRFPGEVSYYSNDQPPTMLWYHDHALGITRLNVMAGLAGLYFIRDEEEQALGLPAGRYEIPLAIQDKRFHGDGSIFYPSTGVVPEAHPVWQSEYMGDVGMVNGAVTPFLTVEARKYRFRIVNAANSTFFNLRLISKGLAMPLIQIGSDLGFLPAPVVVQSLLLANAERADVIVDFSGREGEEIVMTNDAPNPYPTGARPPALSPAQLMQFRVVQPSGVDTSRIPAMLPAVRPLTVDSAVGGRDILLSSQGRVMAGVFMPTMTLLENTPYEQPAITKPRAGTTELWRYINNTGVAHPQHIHLAHQQVLDRQPFDRNAFRATGQIIFTGPPIPAALNEVNAPKDTIRVDSATVVRILARFDLPPGTKLTQGQTFRYMHHCHMLEHEDNEMMRPLEVVVAEGPRPAAAINPSTLTTVQREMLLDGSASTGEGITYAWRSVGPKQAAILPSLDVPKVTVQFSTGRGDYMFELTVTDTIGQTSTATATISYQGL